MESSQLLTALEDAVRRQALRGATLLVGVSGGTDSLALLHGLAQVAEPLDLRLVVAHFDHQLRPDSAADARFVQEVAHSFGLPARVGSTDVRALASQRGMGIEEAARQARLRFFLELTKETGASAVALGHTRDDQVESRLLHLARGTGLRGLVGMAEDSTQTVDGEAIRIVRPLLALGRVDTEAYCAAVSLQPLEDCTNRDLAFTRNRIRHAVVPELRQLNPRLDDALERLGRTARAAEEFVESELDRRIPEIVEVRRADWLIGRPAFRELPEALKRALVRRAAEAAGVDVGAAAIETALIAGDSWPAGTRLTWPNGGVVRVEHDWLSIGCDAAEESAKASVDSVAVPQAGGETALTIPRAISGRAGPVEAVLRVRRQSGRCQRLRDRWHADFDARRIGGALTVRRRRPGDRLAAEGLEGTKKLQDILVDAHVPRGERDLVPLLATSDSVAWVIGLRRNRELLAEPDCDDVLCCEIVNLADDRGSEI